MCIKTNFQENRQNILENIVSYLSQNMIYVNIESA